MLIIGYCEPNWKVRFSHRRKRRSSGSAPPFLLQHAMLYCEGVGNDEFDEEEAEQECWRTATIVFRAVGVAVRFVRRGGEGRFEAEVSFQTGTVSVRGAFLSGPFVVLHRFSPAHFNCQLAAATIPD